MPDLRGRGDGPVAEVSRQTIEFQDDIKVLNIKVGDWDVSDHRWVKFIAAVLRSTHLNHVETLRFVGCIHRDERDPTRKYLARLCAAQMVPWLRLCPNVNKIVMVRCNLVEDAGGRFTRTRNAPEDLMRMILAKPLIKVAWSEIEVAPGAQVYWEHFMMCCHEIKPCISPGSFATAANQDLCIRLMGRFGLVGERCQHFNLMSCSTVSRPRVEFLRLLRVGGLDWSNHLWTVGMLDCADVHGVLNEVIRLGGGVHLGGLIVAHHNRDLCIDWEGEVEFVNDDPNLPNEDVDQRLVRRLDFYDARELVRDAQVCALLKRAFESCPNLKRVKGGKCSLVMRTETNLPWYEWEMTYEWGDDFEAAMHRRASGYDVLVDEWKKSLKEEVDMEPVWLAAFATAEAEDDLDMMYEMVRMDPTGLLDTFSSRKRVAVEVEHAGSRASKRARRS
jgi:hypothetical protein